MMINSSHDLIPTTSPTWKLYHNPFFNDNNSHHCSASSHHHHLQRTHSRHSRKPPVSFWDHASYFEMEDARVDVPARAQIKELKAELEYERKLRKKVEILNKKLARELGEERRGREALAKVCENLAGKITADGKEIDRMKREMEDERTMLRMAEVLREERVQMKLSDARLLWEEKLSKLRSAACDVAAIEEILELGFGEKDDKSEEEEEEKGIASQSVADLSGKFRKLIVSGDKWWDDGSRERVVAGHRSGCGLGSIENPHIRRGIKGYVEFPRMVHRSNIGMKSSKHWGTKLECQKAQLRILLKQRSPIPSNRLIIS